MGFSLKKAIKGVRNTVKKAAAPVTRITEKVLKPVARPLRPVVSKVIPFVAPAALVLKAKAFGIRSERGVAGYKRSQKVARIGTAAAAVVGGAIVAAPAVAGVVGGIGLPSVGTLASGVGLAPSVLSMLGGGGPTEDTAWNPASEIADAIRHDQEAAQFRDTAAAGFVNYGGAPDPAEYAPSPAWPARPDGAAAPTDLSPVLALVGAGVGLYLLMKGG
jgi:hypothetical protein